MKRLLCVLLSLTMLCGLCACGGDSEGKTETTKGATTTATQVATTTGTTADGEDAPTTTTAGTTATAGSSATETAGDSTTTAVLKPTATKPTKPEEGEENAIRILAIGDNYAVDAMEKYLYDLLKSAGYDTVHLGLLYADKSNLDTHYNAVKNDTKTYEFRQNNSGKWTKETKVAPSKAFKAAKWDYVILQQEAAKSGQDSTYGKLNSLTAAVQKQVGDASLFWHMGWSFRRQSDFAGFENYKYNEKVMYKAIVENTLKHVMRNNEVMGLIPTATTIQNLRTSTLRDQLTKDGARLTDYGAYAVALTWYAFFTGESAADATYRPSDSDVKARLAELAEAADNALSVPNEVTSITAGEGEIKDLKILSIGHSFSLDAMRTYMWDLFDAAGYNVTIAYLYYPSCSLEQHYHYIKDNSKSYEQYGKNENGTWVTQTNVAAETALFDEDWDIVTFQPDPDYGHGKTCYCEWGCNKVIDSDYVHFNDLVDMVKTKLAYNGNKDVKFYYHLTWTWRADCYLYNSVSKGYDQQTLWQAFIDATDKNVLTNDSILGVIPCNTAIQNARTTWMGDTFNAEGGNDGYHLSDKGDLIAALTWVSYFTGVKASKIFYDSDYSDAQVAAFAEAVENALAKPREVTQSKYKTQP